MPRTQPTKVQFNVMPGTHFSYYVACFNCSWMLIRSAHLVCIREFYLLHLQCKPLKCSIVKNELLTQLMNVFIKSDDPKRCLFISKHIRKQCEAWSFCVSYEEGTSDIVPPILRRSFTITQTAFPVDIIIFREAIRIICNYYCRAGDTVVFNDIFTIPKDNFIDFT